MSYWNAEEDNEENKIKVSDVTAVNNSRFDLRVQLGERGRLEEKLKKIEKDYSDLFVVTRVHTFENTQYGQVRSLHVSPSYMRSYAFCW